MIENHSQSPESFAGFDDYEDCSVILLGDIWKPDANDEANETEKRDETKFDKASVERNITQLSSTDPAMRSKAEENLQKAGPDAIPLLQNAAIDSTDLDTRYGAQRAIDQIIKNDRTGKAAGLLRENQSGTYFTEKFDPVKAKTLIDDLANDDTGKRERAQGYLQRMGREVIPLLKKAGSIDDLETRFRAIKSIAKIETIARKEEDPKAAKVAETVVKLASHAGLPTDITDKNPRPKAPSKELQSEIENALVEGEKLNARPGFNKTTTDLFWKIKNEKATPEDQKAYADRNLTFEAKHSGNLWYAKSLAQGDQKEQAKGKDYLLKHLKNRPDEIADDDVLAVAVKVGAHNDPAFVKEYVRLGGQESDLAKALKKK